MRVAIRGGRPPRSTGMAVDAPVRPEEARGLEYFGNVVGLGRFTCAPGDPAWREENRIGVWPLVAFPETTVRIHQAGHEEVVSTPNHAMCYRAGQHYRRGLVSPEGDRCTYVVVSPAVLAEMTGELGTPAEPDEATFPSVIAPIPPGAFLAHRAVVRHVARSPEPDGLRLEETLLGAVRAVVAGVVPRSERPEARRRPRTEAAHAEAVEDTKAVLGTRYAERLTLEAVAREVHTSPYHLARVFRRRTGLAIHEYRTQLRLRAALDRLDGGDSLADVAVGCGFASHSHLTDAFRRAFGATPSAERSADGVRSAGAMQLAARGRPD